MEQMMTAREMRRLRKKGDATSGGRGMEVVKDSKTPNEDSSHEQENNTNRQDRRKD